jgi:lipoate-protein ligase A
MIGPHKVVGSAQRRFRGALLQHGAILLAQSPHTPELPGIADLTGRRLAIEDVMSALCQQLGREAGWVLETGTLQAGEMDTREHFLRTRYTNPAWNDKR